MNANEALGTEPLLEGRHRLAHHVSLASRVYHNVVSRRFYHIQVAGPQHDISALDLYHEPVLARDGGDPFHLLAGIDIEITVRLPQSRPETICVERLK